MKEKLVAKSSVTCGDCLCGNLLTVHVVTNCDATSAFAGKEKAKGFELLLHKDNYLSLFKELGETWKFPEGKLQEIEEFVFDLYGHK